MTKVCEVRQMFLDSNCYLSFYKLASVDLEELRKLVALVHSGEICLYITQQVRDEVARNRSKVVATSIDDAKKRNPSGGYPQLLRNYDGFAELDQAQREFSQKLNALVEVVEADAIEQRLHADKLIASLFADATLLDDGEVLQRARERIDRGNPPGKGGSSGDAINWEAMLEGHPDQEDLDFITDDRDFRSPLVDDDLNEFLAKEWADRKRSKVRLYRDLAKFFIENFPAIKVAEDVVRNFAVNALASSSNFASTHVAITELERIGTFTVPQVDLLLGAAVTNSQVRWLLQDNDVSAFYTRLLGADRSGAAEEDAATVDAWLRDLPPGTYPGAGPFGYDCWDGNRWEPF
jgi:PIN domain